MSYKDNIKKMAYYFEEGFDDEERKRLLKIEIEKNTRVEMCEGKLCVIIPSSMNFDI